MVVHMLILQTGLKRKIQENSKIENNKCFQYTISIALNFEEIESHHPERVSNILNHL